MSDTKESVIEFPCHFPIKAMGLNSAEFEAQVVTLVRKHCPDLSETAVASRDSKGGKYLSVTVTVRATNPNNGLAPAVYELVSAADWKDQWVIASALAYDWDARTTLYLGHNFGGETLSLHTGHRKDLAQLRI